MSGIPKDGFVTIPDINMNEYDVLFFTPIYTSQTPVTYQFCAQLGLVSSGIYVRNSDGSYYTKTVAGYYSVHKKI